MSDGCWIQFWDDKNCTGATLRFDEDTGSGARLVSDLDDYQQSDGDKEGNEPDSLVTGSRAWLVVYKDDDFGGSEAMFGPNTRVDVLDDYGFGGNISSFKLYDYRPSWFNETTAGSAVAYEANDESINAQTVNNLFRTVVGAALTLIPGVGSALSILVRGLWPDVDNRDQVWGAFQNYLNQSIAGVYWQLSYEYLNDTLESLYKAAEDFVEISEDAHQAKTDAFKNLYNEVNNNESYFVDEQTPEKRFSFLVPFATLRLATLQENLRNYAYYYGSEPSQAEVDRLTAEIKESIDLYLGLLTDARTRILGHRDQMIFVEDDNYLIDLYSGKRTMMSEPDTLDSRRYYAENVLNKLALRLDEHMAVSQLWPHFDPDVTTPVEPPVLTWIDGPMGYYWYEVPDFSQMAGDGQISRIDLWTYSDGPNPEQQNGLELYIDGVGKGRVGGEGGRQSTLDLTSNETVVEVSGNSTLRYLRFFSDTGKEVSAGDPYYSVNFTFALLPDTANGRLIGVSGSAGKTPDDPVAFANVKAIAAHWRCELPFDTESLPPSVKVPTARVAETIAAL